MSHKLICALLASAALIAGCQTSRPAQRAVSRLTPVAVAKPNVAEPRHLEMPDGQDVLDKALEMNSDKYARPPSDFRRGHVTKAKLDPAAVTRTKAGFQVRLPSRASVVSPTVYQGKVLFSGGFRSKQFFAVRVETGEPVWGAQLDVHDLRRRRGDR